MNTKPEQANDQQGPPANAPQTTIQERKLMSRTEGPAGPEMNRLIGDLLRAFQQMQARAHGEAIGAGKARAKQHRLEQLTQVVNVD
jgi:hypothetical protein